jgi:methylthioribulose-1-phosphate dehydratase
MTNKRALEPDQEKRYKQKTEISHESNDPEHPSNLIPELCRLFYTLGWVTGTGGGISIKKE